MRNITIAILESMYVNAANMWQWDYGQILRIQGKNIPKAVGVHFSLNEKGGDSITRIGTTIDGITDVPIPDTLLENNGAAQDYIIYAFVYLEDGESGNTEYKIRIPVKSRPKPEIPGTPEEPELFRETVKAVNAAADRAEVSEKNAKTSEEEARKYAASASSSAEEAKKTKEDAIKEVAEKKREAISAIEEQEKSSANSITNHTDGEIQRIQNQVTESETELEQTIKNASIGKTALDGSINMAGKSKNNLDESIKSATIAKTALDTSTEGAKKTKTALDGSIKTAGEKQTALDITVKAADKLDTSLKEQITTGTQLQKDLVASGEKSVQDIKDAGSEQLDEMQKVAEEFTADREQVTINKEDIGNLEEKMRKNFLNDAKTKRSLDALWKLNQGISYQFETDVEKAYQKEVPSGAKLVNVKMLGGRTIVWNQMVQKIRESTYWDRKTVDFRTFTVIDGEAIFDLSSINGRYIQLLTTTLPIRTFKEHKYYTHGNIKSKNVMITSIDNSSRIGGRCKLNNDIFHCISSPVIDYNTAFLGITVNITDKGEDAKIYIKNLMVIDLTKMFGKGNEPATVEEFESIFPEDYYEYNGGTLLSMPVNEVVETGKNLLDTTRIHYGTYYSDSKCELVKNENMAYSEPIKCDANSDYILSAEGIYAYSAWLCDEENNPVRRISFANGKCIHTNTNEKFIKISFSKGNNQRIINGQLERGSVVTDYKQYHNPMAYTIPQAILDLDGYGDSASDDVYNYVDFEAKTYHRRVGRVDLGSLNWKYSVDATYFTASVSIDYKLPANGNAILSAICTRYSIDAINNVWANKKDKTIGFRSTSREVVVCDSSYTDATTFKQAMQGVMLYYELAEEEIIDISNIINNMAYDSVEVEPGGTLTFKNSNGGDYRLPIPNEEEYIVSLAEVGGDSSDGSATQNDG